jgi:hypothetical protein
MQQCSLSDSFILASNDVTNKIKINKQSFGECPFKSNMSAGEPAERRLGVAEQREVSP